MTHRSESSNLAKAPRGEQPPIMMPGLPLLAMRPPPPSTPLHSLPLPPLPCPPAPPFQSRTCVKAVGDFGPPQTRYRTLMLFAREDEQLPPVPAPSHKVCVCVCVREGTMNQGRGAGLRGLPVPAPSHLECVGGGGVGRARGGVERGEQLWGGQQPY